MTPTTAVMDAPAPTGDAAPTESAALDSLIGTLNGDSAPAESEPAAGTQDTPPGEGPTSEPTTSQPETAPGGEAPTSEYQLTEDGSAYLVPKDQLADIKSVREYATKVQEKFPTIQDAEAAQVMASNLRHIQSDFLSGDPQSIDMMLGYFAGRDVLPEFPDLRAQFQQSFVKMAERVPDQLKSISPEAHDTFVRSLMQRTIEECYQQASQSGAETDLKTAQWLDYAVNGQYKTELSKADPSKLQDTRLTAKEQEISQRETALFTRDWESFNKTQVDGRKWNEFFTDLDKTLEPVKGNYDPAVWPDIRQGIVNRVIAKLKEDSIWARDHGNTLRGLQQSFQQRWKRGQDASDLMPSINAFRNDFLVRARRLLPSIAKPLLEKAPARPAPKTTSTAKPQAPRPGTQPGRADNGQFQKREDLEAEKSKVLDSIMQGF